MREHLNDEALATIFRDAFYRVDDPAGAFRMIVDRHSPELARCQARAGVSCSAFITACNPDAVEQDDARNATAQAQLELEVAAHGYRAVRGAGGDPAGRWKEEPSLLVLGIDADAARRLGVRFRQRAILIAGDDATPRLWMLGEAEG